jgi:hypothetical protein
MQRIRRPFLAAVALVLAACASTTLRDSWYDPEYNATKVFVMTDRPVYRPGNPIKFKFWVNHAKYDLEGKSEYAGGTFNVEVRDPKNEKVKEFTGDRRVDLSEAYHLGEAYHG